MSDDGNHAIVLCGPSGVGKTAIQKELVQRYPDRFARVVTCTTRPPRAEEKDGVDYHFLSTEHFWRGVAECDFMEHTEVHGNMYGTRKKEVRDILDRDMIPVLVLDRRGAAHLRVSQHVDACIVCLWPVGDNAGATLAARMRARGGMTDEQIEARLDEDTILWKGKSQSGLFDAVIAADTIDATITGVLEALDGTISRAERFCIPSAMNMRLKTDALCEGAALDAVVRRLREHVERRYKDGFYSTGRIKPDSAEWPYAEALTRKALAEFERRGYCVDWHHGLFTMSWDN